MGEARELAVTAIRNRAMDMGVRFDVDARVETATDNLVRRFTQWPSIREELEDGGGGELKSEDGRRPKFHSVHSSAALCVNAFAPFKEHPGDMQLLGYGPFSVARFEMDLNTGMSKPYLDFYLECDQHIVGIESKFTEWLSPKVPDAITDRKSGVGNLTKYVNGIHRLRVIPEGFAADLLKYYVAYADETYLDVAQLIKHALGLFARADEVSKRPVLVYAYWTPRNASDLPEHKQHMTEIADFGERISPFLAFRAVSYADLWTALENDPRYRDVAPLLQSRYEVDVC